MAMALSYPMVMLLITFTIWKVSWTVATADNVKADPEHQVVCVYNDTNDSVYTLNWNTQFCTTIVYHGQTLNSADWTLQWKASQVDLAIKFLSLLRNQRDTLGFKLMLMVTFTPSEPDQVPSSSEVKKLEFISRLTDTMRVFGFNGVVIRSDPRSKDSPEFTEFVNSVLNSFEGTERSVWLSLPGCGSSSLNLKRLRKWVDYFIIETHDLVPPSPHTASVTSPLSGNYNKTISMCIDRVLGNESSLPKHRVIISVSFLVRKFNLFDKELSEPGDLALSVDTYPYYKYYGELSKYKMFFMPVEASAFGTHNYEWVTMETPETIKIKCDYLRHVKLGGLALIYVNDLANPLKRDKIDSLGQSMMNEVFNNLILKSSNLNLKNIFNE